MTGDSNNENNNDYANIEWAKFGINIKILFIKKIRCREAIKDYINNNKIDVVTILMTILRFKIFSNKNNFILIRHCQVAD